MLIDELKYTKQDGASVASSYSCKLIQWLTVPQDATWCNLHSILRRRNARTGTGQANRNPRGPAHLMDDLRREENNWMTDGQQLMHCPAHPQKHLRRRHEEMGLVYRQESLRDRSSRIAAYGWASYAHCLTPLIHNLEYSHPFYSPSNLSRN